MANNTEFPPPLPPRKSTTTVISPILTILPGEVSIQPLGPVLHDIPEHASTVPPPLPPRQVRSESTNMSTAVLESTNLELDEREIAAGPSRTPRPISVEVTPATPELQTPASPARPINMTSRSILREEPSVPEAVAAPSVPETLPNPPQTAPATLSIPAQPPSPARTPPPLPRRPSTVPAVPLPSVPLPAIPPPTLWIGMTLVVAVLAYYRLASLWLILAGVGGLAYLQPKVFKEEETGPERTSGTDRAEARSAVGWVNHVLYALFPLVSTDVLAPFIDLLEDALIQQVPPIVTSVRLEAPALGNQPLLLTSLRPMTDEEWFAAVSKPSPDSKGSHPLEPGAGKGHRKTLSGNLGEMLKGHRRGKSEGAATMTTGFGRNRSGSASSVASMVDNDIVQVEAERRRRRDKVLRRVHRDSKENMKSPIGHEQSPRKGAVPIRQPTSADLQAVQPQSDADNQTNTAGPEADTGELDEDDPLGGQYVNFQVGFEYKRPEHTKRKGYGLHVLGYFGVGVKGLGRTELPVYIDMLGIKGTINLRLLLSATPPFARTATVSFPRLPEFDISAKPLIRSAFNAMSLPGMKPFVQASIADVARIFVRPESYTLDVDRLLLGREAAFRTASIGVLHIIIHSAEGLPKVDTMGTCDPYVAVGFAKYHKPMFSTRTLVDTQNPSWEEPAFVLVTSDEIESGESLRLRICDADRFSADDAVGVVEVELADLIDQTSSLSEPRRRTDQLQSDAPGMKVSGSLTWSVRFAPIWHMPPEELERRMVDMKAKRRGGCTDNPPFWLDWVERIVGEKPEWVSERNERNKETLSWFTGEREKDEMEVMAKPSEEYRSGVLQFHIHQCTELEVESLEGTYSANSSARKSAAGGRPALADIIDRTSAENPEPPSAYVEVHVNDRLVFRTRTKQVTPLPYFNAVSERFLRDWRMAKLVFVVRDERDREHDPILGIVTLRLEEAFRERSQFTRWYPLVGGLGWGRIRISLLWKPIDIHLPPRVSAFEVATLEIKSISATDLSHLADKKGIAVLLETEADSFMLASDHPEPPPSARKSLSTPRAASFPSTPDTPSGPSDAEMEWDITRPIRLAVEYRHSCHVLMSFITRHGVMRKKRVVGLASIRLNDVEDNAELSRIVPIFATSEVKDAIIAMQAYTDNQRGEATLVRTPTREVPVLGFVSLDFVLRPGVSRAHRKLAKKDLRFKRVYEAWEVDQEVRHGLDDIGTKDFARELRDGSGSEEEESEIEDDMLADGEHERGIAGKKVRRTPSGKSIGGQSAISTSGVSGVSQMDEEDDGNMAGRRAHQKALHRRNKGIFQLKIARTGKFVKDMVEAKLYARTSDRRMRGADLDVEQEGQSKL